MTGKLFLVGGFVVVIIMVISGALTYYGQVYSIDRANGYVDLAASTNNMSEVLLDLNQTLAILGPYHGNPNLLFPTGNTNFDLIKQQLNATIGDGLKVVHESPDNYSYQQALKNIQSDLTTTLEGELHDVAQAVWTWSWGVWWYLAGPLTAGLWIMAVIAW